MSRVAPLFVLLLAPATALAGNPHPYGPEDDHVLPDLYSDPSAEVVPPLWTDHIEYPLAATFNPAYSGNYTAGGMISYDYVVVHTVQGSYYGCQSWFQNPDAQVSAHFVMRSEDGEATQMVHLSDRAWHVGGSNPYAIGIEHEGFVDEPAWYTWPMYRGSALLARWIADELGIPLDRDHIVGHVELPNQSHTDPGINWNWDLYMALIWDLVPQGWVEGWVVDRSGCTVTTTVDTWIKTTLQQSDELGDSEKCFVPAGTPIAYQHATPIMGHYRLLYDSETGPCAGFIGLDTEGFVYGEHVSATCVDADKAALGTTVRLDGVIDLPVDGNGYFAFPDVGAGPHTIDVIGNGLWVDTVVPFDVDVFPGERLVIAVDPVAGPGDGDGDGETGGAETDGECWIGAEDCPCTPGGGCDPGLTCEAGICEPTDEAGADAEDDADEFGETGLEAGLDQRDGGSCSVASNPRAPAALFGLALFGLASLRRRRS